MDVESSSDESVGRAGGAGGGAGAGAGADAGGGAGAAGGAQLKRARVSSANYTREASTVSGWNESKILWGFFSEPETSLDMTAARQ